MSMTTIGGVPNRLTSCVPWRRSRDAGDVHRHSEGAPCMRGLAAVSAERRSKVVDHHWLLIALVLTWAVSWPVIKVGVASVPPLWFAALRYAIAAPCLFAVVAL